TVMYVISPALDALRDARSRLYSPKHAHLFRAKSPATV
ncbi:MAG: precorrin-4 C(11)-methyltransferase, partial [Cyanothece sp. SIO2G6]|nr:precorrin-4 C(11)-methyltransferase [Cyanothece sp. SIO2G6]